MGKTLVNPLAMRAMHRRNFMKLGAAASVAALQAPSIAMAQDVTRIPVAIAAGLDTSPLFAAIDQGIFRKNDIVITPNIFFSGVELLNSAISGQSLISVVGVSVTAAALKNGLPIKVIAIQHGDPTADYYSTCRGIAREGSGIVADDFSTLKGKTIGTPLGTDGEAGILAYAAEAGLSKDDIKLVQVAPPDMVGALSSGSVDAVVFVEPWPTLVEFKVKGAYRFTTKGPNIYSPGVIVASLDTIAKKRDTLVSFLTGAAAGQKWARGHTDELLQINSRWTNIDEAVAAKALPAIHFDMRMSKNVLNNFQNVSMPALVKLGILEKPIPMSDFVDATLMADVQKSHPEDFDDLPPIPAGDML